MNPAARRSALAAAALSLTAALAACSGTAGSDDSHHGMVSASPSAGQAAGAQAGDVMFAQMMIPHHEQAVEMADLALTKPDASAEVRALAEQIKGAQDPEIATMTRWLQEWGAPAAPADAGHSGVDHGTASGMMSEEDLASLAQATGADFDEKWISLMIAHHEGAVLMANDVLATTADPEVQELAEAVVDAQTEEIEQMRSMS